MKILSFTRKQYYKSNKARREVLVTRSGYMTETTMLRHAKFKEEEPKEDQSKQQKLDYIIAFDTTGSMNSYIVEVRSQVVEMLNQIFDPSIDVRIKIVAFGDYCDARNVKLDGAYFDSGFSTDKQYLNKFIKRNHSTWGGDSDEFYELVLHKAIRESQWRPDARKAMLLIGDYEPHNVGYKYKIAGKQFTNKIDWNEECKIAAKNNITIDTLSIHGFLFYQEVAKITGGNCYPFRNSNASEISQLIIGTTFSYTSEKLFKKKLAVVEDSSLSEDTKTAYRTMKKRLIK